MLVLVAQLAPSLKWYALDLHKLPALPRFQF